MIYFQILLVINILDHFDLNYKEKIFQLFLRIVEADQLNHPPILFNINVNNNSLIDVLFEIITTTVNTLEVSNFDQI